MRLARLLGFAVLLTALPARADIAIIVNTANPLRQVSAQQLSDFYLGRARAFPSGEYALIFDLPRGHPLRDKFFAGLTGMSPQQVNAYWSRLMFTGQVLPPQPLPDERAMLDIVRRNPGAIGYVHADNLDAGVRVIFTLKAQTAQP